jgi:ParB-like chromosome segregation protein Spo0J
MNVMNPRKISQTAIDKVASSIKEFGRRQRIVVDATGIIDGSVRWVAAQKLGHDRVRLLPRRANKNQSHEKGPQQ